MTDDTLPSQGRFVAHLNAGPLVVSFYGDGEQWLGPALNDFFGSSAITAPRTELCRIMAEDGSDKGTGSHNYTLLYHFLFRHRRYEITTLFELGLGTNFPDAPSSMGEDGIPGASLRGWKRYFPRAQIFGADIDTRILFSEERISTFYVDQSRDDSVGNLWLSLPDERFDIILDDGLHSFDANTTFFRGSIQKLKTNGYYIIDRDNLRKFHDFFSRRMESGVILRIPNVRNDYDNCLGIFLRASAHAYKDEDYSNDREVALTLEVERANIENKALRAEAAKLDAERAIAIAEFNRIKAECEAFRRSTSWRVTRPLRWLRRQLP